MAELQHVPGPFRFLCEGHPNVEIQVRKVANSDEAQHQLGAFFQAILMGGGATIAVVYGAGTETPGRVGCVQSSDADELKRFRRDYALFEELSPPDMPRSEFAKACFEAWEKAQEEGQEEDGK